MNGLVTKPLEDVRLRGSSPSVDWAWTPSTHANTVARLSRVARPPVDLARFHQVCDWDPQFEREFAEIHFTSAESLLLKISNSLKAADRATLAKAAHELNGASSTICASQLCEAAHVLETKAPVADLGGLQEIAHTLAKELVRAREFMAHTSPPELNSASNA